MCSYVVLCCICCYGCCTSQERINVFAVPTVCQVFFQPLSLRLAYHGFSEQCGQCEQQDNGHHEQDHQYTWTTVHWFTKSWAQLSDYHFHFFSNTYCYSLQWCSSPSLHVTYRPILLQTVPPQPPELAPSSPSSLSFIICPSSIIQMAIFPRILSLSLFPSHSTFSPIIYRFFFYFQICNLLQWVSAETHFPISR